MGFYIIIIIILIIAGLLEFVNVSKKIKGLIVFIIFLLFVFQDGLRWETGTDWLTYKGLFEENPYYTWVHYEIGYNLLMNLIKSIYNNYTFFLIINAFIIYFLYLKSIKEYSPLPFITILFFYCTLIGYMGMNRQHLALAISLYSFRYILNRNALKFFLLIAIASLFHVTALVFLPAYFFTRKFKIRFYLIAIIIALIINYSELVQIVLNLVMKYNLTGSSVINQRLSIYQRLPQSTNTILGLIFGTTKRLVLFLILFSIKEKMSARYPNFNLAFNLYFISILFYFAFSNSFQLFVGRTMLFFGIYEIFMFTFLIAYFKKQINQLIIYFLLVSFFFIVFYKSISPYKDLFIPYKGKLINKDYHRDMY